MQAETMQQTLENILTLEVQVSAALLTCILAERRALSARDNDALQHTTGEKLEHTRQLEALEQKREQMLARLGFSNDPAGLRRCLKNQPHADRLSGLWQQVLETIKDCRNANLTNGGILEASRQHVEQALCLLRGQSASPALYSPRGEAGASLGHRHLGKA
jgi:flagella synthesis protein FlgN